jgi:hypothetical protein
METNNHKSSGATEWTQHAQEPSIL